MRRFVTAFALLALGIGVGACGSETGAAADVSADDLRQIQKQDVDELIVDKVPVGSKAPDALGNIATWSVHHVQFKDPNDPTKPDPVEPFNGFFLVAKDANGNAVFFDTLALTDEGVAHFYFSFRTDDKGNYVEIPLSADPADPAAVARAEKTVGWLSSERSRLATVIETTFGGDTRTLNAGVGFTPQAITTAEWKAGIKCAADLAIFVLKFSAPIQMLLLQAASDATFAAVDAFAGSDEAAHKFQEAGFLALMAGMGAGAIGAVNKIVQKGLISSITGGKVKAAGGGLLGLGLLGVVGFQFYGVAKDEGALAGAKAVGKMLIPVSCQQTYASISHVPHNDMTPTLR